MVIYCVECQADIEAEIVQGSTVYTSRPDLNHLKFWRCATCKNSIGCHKGTTKPLGVIANKELKQARIKIHSIIDPIWKSGKMSRKEVYQHITRNLGYVYHTGEISSLDEARDVWRIAAELHNSFI